MARKTKNETGKTVEMPARKTAGKAPRATRAEKVETDASPAPSASVASATPPAEPRPNRPAPDEARSRRNPTHEEISRRAHELWVKRGGVGGTAQDDWLRAERELRAAASR